jgi:hypothetical protein
MKRDQMAVLDRSINCCCCAVIFTIFLCQSYQSLLGLRCNSSNTLLHFLQISQIATSQWCNPIRVRNRFEIVIQLVNKWNTSRTFQSSNLIRRNSVQMFDQGTKCISVGCNDDLLSLLDLWANYVLPLYQKAVFCQCILTKPYTAIIPLSCLRPFGLAPLALLLVASKGPAVVPRFAC